VNLRSTVEEAAAARDAKVKREQLETLLLQGLPGAVATVLVSAVYVLAVWKFEAPFHLAAWFGFGVLLGVLRVGFAWRVRSPGGLTHATRTLRAVAVAFAAAAGAQWGYASVMFVPTSSGGLYFLLAALLVGMPAGAILSFGGYVPAYAAYLLCSVLPFSVGFALADDFYLQLAGAAGFVLSFYLLRTSFVNAAVLRRNILQRLELEAMTGSLAQARDAAESANRAKSSFLANMSHELRTPLNAVVGLSELLQQTSDNPQAIGHAATIRKSALSLLDLITDVLDLSRIEAGAMSLRPKVFALPELLRDIAAMFAPVAERQGLRFSLTLAEDLPASVEADSVRLRQVLVNLVGNAMKFTSAGEVRLVAELEARSASEAWVRFAVSDTGIGIDAHAQADLFTPFMQVADGDEGRARRGTGLGLAITAELVGLMRGVLAVDSAPGRGSTFTLSLPLRPAPAHAAPAANDASVRAIDACRVLLVEDNEVNQVVASEMLLALGCEVRIADSGQAALVELMAERYDLVLMDCMMPGMNGFETTAAWRTHERLHGGHVPIVALTANAIAGDRESCLAAGMDDYLSKPVSLDKLRGVIARHAGRAA